MKNKWWISPLGELIAFTANNAKFDQNAEQLKIHRKFRFEPPWDDGKRAEVNYTQKMNEELEKGLLRDFPGILKVKTFSCGNGWEQIIRIALDYISGCTEFIAEVKEPFYGAYKLDVGLHNTARKVERLFGLPAYTLYKQKLSNRYGKFGGFKTKITEVKEKFGTLRIYYEVSDNFKPSDAAKFSKRSIDLERSKYIGWVGGIIDYAESLSGKTCENDGSPGVLHSCGSWKTLCYECATNTEKL
jgi:hypothetical protein